MQNITSTCLQRAYSVSTKNMKKKTKKEKMYEETHDYKLKFISTSQRQQYLNNKQQHRVNFFFVLYSNSTNK